MPLPPWPPAARARKGARTAFAGATRLTTGGQGPGGGLRRWHLSETSIPGNLPA
jgi:hypothetical protein